MQLFYRTILLSLMIIFCISCSSPKLDVEDEIILREAYWGETITVPISIINRGNNVLTIKEIRNSCGCTSTKLDTSNIQPNEKGILEVTVTLDILGKKEVSVSFLTNDPQNKEKVINITVLTENIWLVNEDVKIYLKEITYDKPIEKKLVLSNTLKDPFRITSYKTTNENISLAYDASVMVMHNIMLRINNPESKESLYDQLTIYTDHPLQEKFVIPVRVEYKKEIDFGTEIIFFGIITLEKKFSKNIVGRLNLETSNFQMHFLRSEPPYVEVKEIKVSGNQLNITVDLNPVEGFGYKNGKMIFETNLENLTQVEIPYSFVVKK